MPLLRIRDVIPVILCNLFAKVQRKQVRMSLADRLKAFGGGNAGNDGPSEKDIVSSLGVKRASCIGETRTSFIG